MELIFSVVTQEQCISTKESNQSLDSGLEGGDAANHEMARLSKPGMVQNPAGMAEQAGA